MSEDLTGVGKVNPSKVDITYNVTDLSDVAYIDIGNKIRGFAAQAAPYYAILSAIIKDHKTTEAIQKAMAVKLKPYINFFVISPSFDYKQPAYLLSYPGREKMRVHSHDIYRSQDSILEAALSLQQLIISNADIDMLGDDGNEFKTTLDAITFGIGPKEGGGKIAIDTGKPELFIDSLNKLFKVEKSAKITGNLIHKYLPSYMSTL